MWFQGLDHNRWERNPPGNLENMGKVENPFFLNFCWTVPRVFIALLGLFSGYFHMLCNDTQPKNIPWNFRAKHRRRRAYRPYRLSVEWKPNTAPELTADAPENRPFAPKWKDRIHDVYFREHQETEQNMFFFTKKSGMRFSIYTDSVFQFSVFGAGTAEYTPMN